MTEEDLEKTMREPGSEADPLSTWANKELAKIRTEISVVRRDTARMAKILDKMAEELGIEGNIKEE